MFSLNLSIFTVFLKNKNIIFKIRRSKVTDYAALNIGFRVQQKRLYISRGCTSYNALRLSDQVRQNKNSLLSNRD